MKIRWPRFSLLHLMTFVGLLALLMAGGLELLRWSRRGEIYRAQATDYANLELVHRTSASINLEHKFIYRDRPEVAASMDELARSNLRKAERFSRLKDRFSRAANRPWESLEPELLDGLFGPRPPS